MKPFMWMPMLALLIAGLTLVACSSSPSVPTDKPLLTGVITTYRADSILVEENPNQQSGSDKCALKITAKTAILREDGAKVTKGTASDLVVGRRVRAWASGPVMDSYPCQGTASVVLMLADAGK